MVTDKKARQNLRATYISTLSTLTPQGSVASSKELCMLWEMLSLSLKISAKFFVPKTFRRVVAASKRVEWLWIGQASEREVERAEYLFSYLSISRNEVLVASGWKSECGGGDGWSGEVDMGGEE